METASRNSKNLKNEQSELYLNTPDDRLAHFGNARLEPKSQTDTSN